MKNNDEIMESKQVWGIQILDHNVFSGFVKLPECGTCSVVWGFNECGMEHVSVSPKKKFDGLGRENIPLWRDMCTLKDIFWREDEEVYQIHPKKAEYVNLQSNCLHLWKPIGRELGELARTGK